MGERNDSLSSERCGHHCTECCVVGGFVMIFGNAAFREKLRTSLLCGWRYSRTYGQNTLAFSTAARCFRSMNAAKMVVKGIPETQHNQF
jgi:hypothetical protein